MLFRSHTHTSISAGDLRITPCTVMSQLRDTTPAQRPVIHQLTQTAALQNEFVTNVSGTKYFHEPGSMKHLAGSRRNMTLLWLVLRKCPARACGKAKPQLRWIWCRPAIPDLFHFAAHLWKQIRDIMFGI